MARFFLRRTIQTILVLFGVSILVFGLSQLTGDPASLMLPLDAPQELLEQMRHEMGLDRPWWVQYGVFLAGVVRGTFGRSLLYRTEVLPLILDRLPATLSLALSATTLSVLVAVPIGVFSAVRRGSLGDRLLMAGALLGQSLPVFWLGMLLVMFLAVKYPLFPTGGRDGGLRSMVLPTVTLAAYFMARTARMTRSSMLDVLGEDFMRTARAKGLHQRIVTWKHGMRNALIPVITMIGLDLGTLLGGAVITESVFSWPGLGRLTLQAISKRDFPLLQGCVLFVAIAYVLINLVLDLSYSALDPRIRYE